MIDFASFAIFGADGTIRGSCNVHMQRTSRTCATVSWGIGAVTADEEMEMRFRSLVAGIQSGAAQVLYEGAGKRAIGVTTTLSGAIKSLRHKDADLLYRWLCESLAAISEQPLPARPKCWEEVPD